jgi:hypothetical protein
MLALALVMTRVFGAELFYMDHDPFTREYVGPTGPLVLSGEIVPGDYERLLAKIAADEDRFIGQNKLILASDGGDIAEAVRIATLVRSLDTEVVVGPTTGRCVGACFLVYSAAVLRGTDGARLLGLTRPTATNEDLESLPAAQVAVAEEKAALQARAFLEENAVPANLVNEMLGRPANDAYFLTERDEASLGSMSPAFAQLMRSKCGWSDTLEADVYGGKRPLDDLKQSWACRNRLTQAAAHQALALARPQPKSGRGK